MNFVNYIMFWRSAEEPRTNIGEEVRRLMNRRDVEDKIDAVSPFLMGSLLAWPAFWLYKGLDWHTRRHNTQLHMYIRKTFYQAKFAQLAILSLGVVFAVAHDRNHTLINAHDDEPDEIA